MPPRHANRPQALGVPRGGHRSTGKGGADRERTAFAVVPDHSAKRSIKWSTPSIAVVEIHRAPGRLRLLYVIGHPVRMTSMTRRFDVSIIINVGHAPERAYVVISEGALI